jgi:streptomycin 6-kinase
MEADAALLLGAAIAAPFNRHPSIIHPVVNIRYDNFCRSRMQFIDQGNRKIKMDRVAFSVTIRLLLEFLAQGAVHGRAPHPRYRLLSMLDIPDALIASHTRYFGAAGRAWLAALPGLAAILLERWALRPAGSPMCGAVALVLPVVRADGSPAVLKLQPVDEETAGEPIALRAWAGRGAVRLLRHDPDTGSMLLDRLDPERSLESLPDDLAALRILSELLVRLNAVTAPPGVRRLADVAGAMLERVPQALARMPDAADRRLIDRCARTVAELLPEAGDRLLHWDLHYDNVLSDRAGGWLAIDPKPLAGDPGFELLAALHNRWADVVATGDVRRAVRRRFDLMTEVLALDRQRAAGWTLGRVLENRPWDVDFLEPDTAIATTLIDSY